MLLLLFTNYMNASFSSIDNAPSSTVLINSHTKEEYGTLLVTQIGSYIVMWVALCTASGGISLKKLI